MFSRPSPRQDRMLWFYERDTIVLRLETRYDSETAEYVALLHYPDGRQELQRFRKLESFRQWLVALEGTLAADQWTRKGSPDILPDGWPEKIPRM
jgi:hypothetical protein